MNQPLSMPARRDLRQRMIEDMSVRGFSAKTQHDYQRIVSRFAAFLGRSPDRATAEDIRRFQVEQREAGMPERAALLAGGRRYLPGRRGQLPCRSSRASQPRPVEGHVGDPELPDRRTRRAC